MWIVVVIVLAVAGKFLYDWNAQQSDMVRRGGMDVVYKELLGYLMSDSRSKIVDRRADSIMIGVPCVVGASVFIVTHSFGKVVVEWRLKHSEYGEHRLDWTFNETSKQEKMAEVILRDFFRYQENVLFKLIDLD